MATFAIIRSGSKQFKVSQGTVFDVESLEGDPGATIKLSEVLLVSKDDALSLGSPLIESAVVQAQVIEQKRDPKVVVFKYKAKKRERTKTGHRQNKTRLKITSIDLGTK
jgi:large subunit ribosomal protein L21